MSRRRALLGLGGLGLTVVTVACGGQSTVGAPASTGGGSSTSAGNRSSSTVAGRGGTPTTAAAGTTASTAAAKADCVLTPEQTEGPYYLDLDLVRRDITEGRPGTPLELTINVVDVAGGACTPLTDAAVDIWHCDAAGVYSGFESGTGQKFLRGTQLTDGTGAATFATIYPGWYPGRTVHIHVKVHAPGGGTNGRDVHTGQLYFDDTITDAVYRSAPYSARPSRDTPNSRDSIYQSGGSATLLKPTEADGTYKAVVTLGVDRSGSAAAAGGAGRGGGPGGRNGA